MRYLLSQDKGRLISLSACQSIIVSGTDIKAVTQTGNNITLACYSISRAKEVFEQILDSTDNIFRFPAE